MVERWLACDLDVDQNRGGCVAPDGGCGLPDLVGTQVFGLDASACGSQSGGSARFASTHCGRFEAAGERDFGANGGQQGLVFYRAHLDDHARHGGLGCDSLWPGHRVGQHQCRSVVHHGDHIDGGLRGGDCRLGFKFQVFFSRCHARFRPDGQL